MQYFSEKCSRFFLSLFQVVKKNGPYERKKFPNSRVLVHYWRNVWESGQAFDAFKLANNDFEVFPLLYSSFIRLSTEAGFRLYSLTQTQSNQTNKVDVSIESYFLVH